MSDLVRQFSPQGNEAFASFLTNLRENPSLPIPNYLLTDAATSEATSFDAVVERTPNGAVFGSRYIFGHYLADALARADRAEISLNSNLWNWLALYYLDQLSPADANGARKLGEQAAYFLPEKYQHNRYYRHLVRSPWLAVALHPVTSRVLLIPISTKGAPLAVRGEIFEQVASRQSVFRSSTILAAIDALYFDAAKGRPHSGTGGDAGGSPRRLAQILKQFQLTYDLEWGNGDGVLSLLPKEFESWKRRGRN